MATNPFADLIPQQPQQQPGPITLGTPRPRQPSPVRPVQEALDHQQFTNAQLDEERKRLDIADAKRKAEASAAEGTIPGDLTREGDAYLKSLEPSLAAQVRMLSEGRLSIPSGMALAKPYWQNLLQATAKYDPSFDAANAATRRKTRLEFTSGVAARNVTAINTALGHLGSLARDAEALNNSSIVPFNSLINSVERQFGDARVDKFNMTRHAVVDEMEKAFRGSGGTQAGIDEWMKSINSSQSPEQLRAAIAKGVELLESRINAMNEMYTQGMGRSSDPLELLTPHAREVFQKLGPRGPGKLPLDPTGEGDIGFENRREVLALPPGAEAWPREMAAAVQSGEARTAEELIRFTAERGFILNPEKAKIAAEIIAQGHMPNFGTPRYPDVDISDSRGKGGIGETVDATVRGIADVPTMGLASEGAAALDSLFGGDSKRYRMAQQNAIDEYDEEHHYWARLGGQIGGGLVLPSGMSGAAKKAGMEAFREAIGSGIPKEAAKVVARAAARRAGASRLGKEGAGYGGAYGVGDGEGNIADRLGSGVVGALSGFTVGRGVPAVASALGSASGRASNALGDVAERLGVTPTPATLGGRSASALQTVLHNAPGSSIAVQAGVEREADQLANAARKVATDLGPATSPEAAGNAITRGARAYNRLGSRKGAKLYAERDALMGGPDAPVELTSARATFAEFSGKYPTSPLLEALRIHPAVRKLEAATSENSVLTLREATEALSFSRTQLRNLRAQNKISRQEEMQVGKIEQAIEDDVMRAAQQADIAAGRTLGPGSAQTAQEAADAHWRTLRRTTDGAMKVATKAGRDDTISGTKVYSDLLGTITEGQTNLRQFNQIWSNLPSKARRTFSATLFDDLGRATPGQQNAEGTAWSFNTFHTNWSKLDPTAKARLFEGADRQRVDDIVTYSARLKKLGRGGNPPNTARHTLAGAWGATVATTLMMGNTTAAATAAATFPALAVAGEAFMRSPQGRRWLATALKAGINGAPKEKLRQLTQRLPKLVATDPAAEEDILGLRDALLETLDAKD